MYAKEGQLNAFMFKLMQSLYSTGLQANQISYMYIS